MNRERHLIYHICPLGDFWRVHLERYLSEYKNVFTGYRVASVVQGEGMANVSESFLKRELFDEVLYFENSKELGEQVTFGPMLNRIRREAGRNGITFYGHTKGVSHNPMTPALSLWIRALYEKNLGVGVPVLVDKLFDEGFCTAGCFRRTERFRHFPPDHTWHYSGTFFWLLNEVMFMRDWRGAIRPNRYAVEAFPGILFSKEESAVLFGDNPGDLYKIGNIEKVLYENVLKANTRTRARTLPRNDQGQTGIPGLRRAAQRQS